MTEEIRPNKDEKWTPYEQLAETPQQTIDRLEQENKELKEQAQLDGECIDKLIEARDMYAKALEEIRNYCDRIEQGSVIGTQDCLINSIKNIVNYTINEVLQ